MSQKSLILAVALTLGSPGAASAQAASDELNIRHQPWPGREAFAGVTTSAALSRSWSANRFYIVTLGEWPNATRHWIVRRAFGEELGPDAGRTTVVWADSRSCPALAPVLQRMERMPAARIDVPGLGWEDDRWGLTFDGVHHRFWSHVRDATTGSRMTMTLEGNLNTPVERWWSETLRRLEACWTTSPPTDG